MAVAFLREAWLPCTEQQMEALTGRLFRPEGLGPANAWGPEAFTEIGTLAGTERLRLLEAVKFTQIKSAQTESGGGAGVFASLPRGT